MMKSIKRRKNSIKIIVDIYNRALDFESLLDSHIFQGEVM